MEVVMQKIIFGILLFCGFVATPFFAMGEDESPAEQNNRFENITAVRVDGLYCAVTVTGTANTDVRMTIKLTDKKTKVFHSVEAGTLHVWVERDGSQLDPRPRGENRIDLEVPRNTGLQAETASGSVIVRSIKNETIGVRTTSGEITMNECDGKKNIASGSGDIQVNNSRGDLETESASGSQTFVNIMGDCRVKSASGDISFENQTGNGTVATASGSLKFKKIKGDVVTNSVSGSVLLENTAGFFKIETISGSINGAKVTLTGSSTFDAVSGSIRIQLANLKDCSFTLETTAGSLEAGHVRGKKFLKTGKGEIEITAHTISGGIQFF
jgi:DUF4097 and DUF4098 domain-containing protein YvlB